MVTDQVLMEKRGRQGTERLNGIEHEMNVFYYTIHCLLQPAHLRRVGIFDIA